MKINRFDSSQVQFYTRVHETPSEFVHFFFYAQIISGSANNTPVIVQVNNLLYRENRELAKKKIEK